MCQEYMDHEGRSQQSLVIDTPKFHKRYFLPCKFRLSKVPYMFLQTFVLLFVGFGTQLTKTKFSISW